MFNDHSYAYIEDDSLSREVMKTILERMMKVDHVLILEDSTDFVNRLSAAQPIPDVILLDIHVRPHSGFEMLDALRKEPVFENAIIIALTASVMSEEIERLKVAGFDGTIAKPLNVRTFPELMEKVVQREPVWHIS
jgi:two-component system cell cycle response regulator DivK